MRFPFVRRKKYDEVVYKLECLLCHANELEDYCNYRHEKSLIQLVMELKKKYTGDATDTNVGGKVEGKNV